MGGRWYHCDACDETCVLYNSCGDRHCPQCGGAKRADWLEKTSRLLLPGIDYYQVVFTMPDRLSSLALGNRKEMFDLLFHTAWASLQSVITKEQGFDPAAAGLRRGQTLCSVFRCAGPANLERSLVQ